LPVNISFCVAGMLMGERAIDLHCRRENSISDANELPVTSALHRYIVSIITVRPCSGLSTARGSCRIMPVSCTPKTQKLMSP